MHAQIGKTDYLPIQYSGKVQNVVREDVYLLTWDMQVHVQHQVLYQGIQNMNTNEHIHILHAHRLQS